jgi:AcrR family transcriptional regulator
VTEPTSLREQQKQDRKERIFTTAMHLFREQGFEQTTVNEIARQAGVSRGTFFNYYPYKELILIEYAAEELKSLEQLKAKAIPAKQKLAQVFSALSHFTEASKDLILPFSYELLNPDPERSRRAFEALPMLSLVRHILKQGQTEGSIRQDYSSERLSRIILNAYFLAALQWASYRQDRAIEEELRKTLTITLEGVLIA